METYHKIQTLFKRHQDGPKKGKMIRGQWTTPELEYLAGNKWEFTEKVDGTNIRVGHYGMFNMHGKHTFNKIDLRGRSDNATIPVPLLEYLKDTFTSGQFTDAGLDNVTLFGEGYGPKIQNGGNYRTDPSFVLFDVKIGDWWLHRKDVNDIASKLGIDSVPTIGIGTLYDAIDIVSTGITFNENGGIVRWGNGGLQSQWGKFEAEGLVCRPVTPLFDRKGDRIICKVKSVDFK